MASDKQLYSYDNLRENAFWRKKENNSDEVNRYACVAHINGREIQCLVHNSWQDSRDALERMIDRCYKSGRERCPTFFFRKFGEQKPFKFHLSLGLYGYVEVGKEENKDEVIYPLHVPGIVMYSFNQSIIEAALQRTRELGLYAASLDESGNYIDFNCPTLEQIKKSEEEEVTEAEKKKKDEPPPAKGWFW